MFAIAPEPEDEELAALAVALTALLDERSGEPVAAPEVPRWAAAGRHDAVRASSRAGVRGWGRLGSRR